MIKPRFWVRSWVASIPETAPFRPAAMPRGEVSPTPEAQTLSARRDLLAHKQFHLHWRRRPNDLAPHTALPKTIRGSPEPDSGSGSRPRVAGCAEARPEPT